MVRRTLLTLCLLPTLMQAAEWKVLPGPSRVGFEIRHLLSTVEGRFRSFEGSVKEGPKGLAEGSIEARIEVASLRTGIRDRDKHLLSEDFFDAEHYPDIQYRSTRIEPKDSGHCFVIHGELTIGKTTAPVTLDTTCSEITELADGSRQMEVRAEGNIDRFTFGLSWDEKQEDGQVLVGREVTLKLEIVLEEVAQP